MKFTDLVKQELEGIDDLVTTHKGEEPEQVEPEEKPEEEKAGD